jgi:hypothetical protein
LAFNNPTDKFMCGVIPGATLLVDEDFHCTDDTGNTDVLKAVLNKIDPTGWLLQRVNLQPGESCDEDHTLWADTLSNEITALLCEFMPYEGAKDHIFSGWKGGAGGPATCPLNSTRFLEVLLSHAQSYSRDRNAGAAVKHVFDQGSKLFKLIGLNDSEQMVQYTRRVFDSTTLWFVSKGFSQHPQNSYGLKPYLYLVKAHCNLSFKAWKATLRSLQNSAIRERKKVSSQAVRDRDSEDPPSSDEAGEEDHGIRNWIIEVDGFSYGWEGKWDTPTARLKETVFARKYLQEVMKVPSALTEYLGNVDMRSVFQPSGSFFDEDFENFYHEAWLVLMLRGIAWFMSQNPMVHTPVRTGGVIPSSFWDNQRPVWII